MRFYLVLCLLATIVATFAQEQYRLEKSRDYMDVPVRAGYRIMGNDKDGYLEDGIIVKTKGTGYIDPRYRKRYQAQYQGPVPAAYDHQPLASYHYPRYLSSEIIYGRREW